MILQKVGIDGRNLGPTGIGRYTRELVLALSKEYPQTVWHLIINDDNAGYLDSTLVARKNIVTNKVKAGYYSFSEQLTLSKEIDSLGLDVVHFTNFNAPYGLKTPMVTTVHDLTLLFFPGRRMWPGKRWFYKKVLTRTLKNAKQIITASEDASKDIIYFAKINNLKKIKRKISIIEHGVSASFKIKPVEDVKIANPFFLIVGAQLPHKNVHRVLEAFADICDEDWAKAYKIVIAGNKTSPAPHMNKVWRKYPKLIDRVEFTGPITDDYLRSLYNEATSLVFASQKEGFGLPILEAFACKCPVIASKISSIPEVAGDAAWYVDPLKIETLACAMREVAAGGSEVTKKIKSGQKRVQRYNWIEASKKTYRAYQKAS